MSWDEIAPKHFWDKIVMVEDDGSYRYFVPEKRIAELERIMRECAKLIKGYIDHDDHYYTDGKPISDLAKAIELLEGNTEEIEAYFTKEGTISFRRRGLSQ